MLTEQNTAWGLSNLNSNPIQYQLTLQEQKGQVTEKRTSELETIKEIQQVNTRNLGQNQMLMNQSEKQQSDRFEIVQKSQKPQPSQTSYKDLLAEHPSNFGPSSLNQKANPPQADSHPNLKKSSTTTNFYVTKKKMNKSQSSQKIIQSKNTKPFQRQQKEKLFNISPNQSDSISEITVLILLYRVIEKMRARGDDMTLECLVNEEKLIHISMAFLEKKIVSRQNVEKHYSLEREIISFVQKINKVTMENFKQEDKDIDIKIFSKAVDLLMTPGMNRFVKDLKTLGKIKVLTFNNLACIYKKKRKFGIALRSVSFALQIEEALLNEQSNQQKYDIIPTYLNKAAILSQMNKHQKAIQEIMKSQKFIEKIQREVIKQITQAQHNSNTELKKRLQEKRYYGLYMKMIINYNMGAEKEHMKMVDAACEYYKQGRHLALMINNQFMISKFQNILNKLMDARKK